MEDDETLDDMVKRNTPENSHPEIDDATREWMEFPNEFDKKEWTWDEKPSEEECIRKTKELIELVKNETFEFTHTAEEIREMNRRV